jgi:hypothetical protein
MKAWPMKVFCFLLFCCHVFAQDSSAEKAEAILKKAIEKLGGERYLQVKTIVSKGNFSIFRSGLPVSVQTFIDVIVLPDKERTDFKFGGQKIVQVNVGKSGWIGDTAEEVIKDQSQEQISNFKRTIRTSIDNLLRGGWREEKATLGYVGKKEAGVGRRNDVIKLSYPDGFEVEFEFSADGLPAKAIYKSKNSKGEETKEEDRYAQFVEVQGILTPFVVDRFQNEVQISRINYVEVIYNKQIPESIFQKPTNIKDLKDLKL